MGEDARVLPSFIHLFIVLSGGQLDRVWAPFRPRVPQIDRKCALIAIHSSEQASTKEQYTGRGQQCSPFVHQEL